MAEELPFNNFQERKRPETPIWTVSFPSSPCHTRVGANSGIPPPQVSLYLRGIQQTETPQQGRSSPVPYTIT